MDENIKKTRKAFFAMGSLWAFQGELNPLSTSSIFETCILPVLLYGCETLLLDCSCLSTLEIFQCEIGRRILRMYFPSSAVVNICTPPGSPHTNTNNSHHGVILGICLGVFGWYVSIVPLIAVHFYWFLPVIASGTVHVSCL